MNKFVLSIALFISLGLGTAAQSAETKPPHHGHHDHHDQHHGQHHGQQEKQESQGHQGHHAATAFSFGQPGDPAKVTKTIEVIGVDFSFAPATFNFAKGDVVRFVFINKGSTDHELTIGDHDMQVAHRKMMADMTNDLKMTHGGHDHHKMGNVVTAKPGERQELVWAFTSSGTFEMACNIPGHAESGMVAPVGVK